MNIALEKCEEHVNGVKKRSYGDAFVRGNNGKFVLEYWGRLRNLG
jgi:U6 snRNA-associated Sm-like protein LSm6